MRFINAIKQNLAKIINYFKQVKVEVGKVTWPGKKETLRYTLTVLGVSVAVALLLGAVDFALISLLNKFIL